METFELGARVTRCNSPADSLVADGVEGVVVEVLQAANGEMGYFVQVVAVGKEAGRRFFSAGNRLRSADAIPNTSSSTP